MWLSLPRRVSSFEQQNSKVCKVEYLDFIPWSHDGLEVAVELLYTYINMITTSILVVLDLKIESIHFASFSVFLYSYCLHFAFTRWQKIFLFLMDPDAVY